MSFEIDENLGQSSPPNFLFIATSSNVNSWLEETMTIPQTTNLGINRRRILLMSVRATTVASTPQILPVDRAASYFFFTRNGKVVTPHVMAPLYLMAFPTGNTEALPIAQWINPPIPPIRGGDILTILVPGDADATPAQDWELNMYLGPELKR